jgi:Family of unknown function (DUF5681)
MAGRWVKGVSGNPLGRPKKYAEIIRLAQSHSTEAIERLVELMRDKRAKAIALRASEVLLDRAWGKVPQAITGELGQGPVKLEVSWKNSEVAVLDITPREDIPLLEVLEDE